MIVGFGGVCPRTCGCVWLARCMSCVPSFVGGNNVLVLRLVWVIGGCFLRVLVVSAKLCVCWANNVFMAASSPRRWLRLVVFEGLTSALA